MSADVLERMRRRAQRTRARSVVRSWEYRQRHHARGVWFRLRRLLADAAGGWRLSEEDAARLIGEGIEPHPVGLAFEPPLTILVVQEARLETVASREPVALRLGADLLRSRWLALVRWP